MADLTLAPETSPFDISVRCETDLSAKQYFFVKLDTSELCVIAGANDKTLGVLQNAPLGTAAAPKVAIVRTGGLTKLKLNEAVAFGNFLTPTSTGNAEVCDAANEEFGARALTSGDSGDLILAEVCHGEVTATDA